MNIKKAGVFVAWLALLVQGPGVGASGQVKWKGTTAKEGDVTVARNPREPVYKTPVLELKEDLSLGGANAQGDYAFEDIRTLVVDDAGNIFVLDSKAANVKVFDASGKYVKTIGRKGQGPGEFNAPMTLSINRLAGELVVHQAGERISYFKLDGTFLRQQVLRGLMTVRARVDSKGRVVVTEVFFNANERRYDTKKLGPDGTPIALLASSPAPDPARFNPFLAISYWQLDREDNVIYGYPASYEILFFGAESNKVFRKITRDYDPVEITDEEKKEELKDIPQGITVEFSKSHSAFTRFFVDDQGPLLVQTWEKAGGGKLVHDVFDREGRFIGRIPLKPSGIGIKKGKYYALEVDEDGYQAVKRYAVKWLIER
ncbi:MAG: 6-bladed beta-propeller [Candidatus Aminicenantales bacterium]